MKKIFLISIILVYLVGCNKTDFVSKESVSINTNDLFETHIVNGNYTFHSQLTFFEYEDLYRSENSEDFTIFTKQISTKQVNDDNFEEIAKNMSRYSLNKNQETIEELYNIKNSDITIRDVDCYKTEFTPKTSNKRIALPSSITYLIPYQEGTIEVSIVGNDLENENIDYILNSIY